MKLDDLAKSIPIFNKIPEDYLQSFISLCVVVNYPVNTVVIMKGNQNDSLYIILKGRLKAYLDDENGKRIILSTMGSGDVFGELSLLSAEPCSANVRALTKCRLAKVSKTDFDQFLMDNPAAISHIIGLLIHRIHHLTEQVSALAFQDVYTRTVQVLHQYAVENNGELVTHPFKQQDIANMVGSSREMVSKILKELRTGGYISMTRKSITIHHPLPEKW